MTSFPPERGKTLDRRSALLAALLAAVIGAGAGVGGAIAVQTRQDANDRQNVQRETRAAARLFLTDAGDVINSARTFREPLHAYDLADYIVHTAPADLRLIAEQLTAGEWGSLQVALNDLARFRDEARQRLASGRSQLSAHERCAGMDAVYALARASLALLRLAAIGDPTPPPGGIANPFLPAVDGPCHR